MVVKRAFKLLGAGARVAGEGALQADLIVRSVPVVKELVPGRRLGLGLAIFLHPDGQVILDYLGDDIDERADRLEDVLSRCSDDELEELLAAVQEAVIRRAAGDGKG